MAYTPTTWTTGDTITASALNKIEQGIADGGGGGGKNPFYGVTTTNFPAGSNIVAFWTYAHKNGNTYESVGVGSFPSDIVMLGNGTGFAFSWTPIPTLEDYYLTLTPASGVSVTSSSGGISGTPIELNGLNAYIVTDDFTITLKGWA